LGGSCCFKRKRKGSRCRIREAPHDIQVEEKDYEVDPELARDSFCWARAGGDHPPWRGAVALLYQVRNVPGDGRVLSVCGPCVSDGADVELDRAVLGRSAGFCCDAVKLSSPRPGFAQLTQAAICAKSHLPAPVHPCLRVCLLEPSLALGVYSHLKSCPAETRRAVQAGDVAGIDHTKRRCAAVGRGVDPVDPGRVGPIQRRSGDDSTRRCT
jgi:hypothetical protein